MDPNSPAYYRRIDSQKIIDTVQDLQRRIERRFPGSGLGKIAAELLRVAEETIERTRWIQRPHMLIRVTAWVLTAGISAILISLLLHIRRFQLDDYTNFIQSLEASLGSVVFIGAAILFLISWENRIKRNRALKAVHELRAMAHIVDMHQLTKDPEKYFDHGQTPTVPLKRDMSPFELNRYLDYCGDMLALISKCAALHVQEFQEPVLLDAVDDVEELTSGLTRKIWQKISILENLIRELPAHSTPAAAKGTPAGT